MAIGQLAVRNLSIPNSHTIMGAVLCGGQSQRFGSDKATAQLSSGSYLGGVAVRALRDAGVDPVVAVGGNTSAKLGVPTVADRWPNAGPLAGLASVLLYATQDHVIVTPCDVPLLQAEHITPLIDNIDGQSAVIAQIDGKAEPILGIWPRSWGKRLVPDIRAGKTRLRDILDVGPYNLVPVPAEAVADADTPEKLITLTQIDHNASPEASSEAGQSRIRNRV